MNEDGGGPFHSSGVTPDYQMARKSSEVRSGEPDAFILRITFVICWYDGGDERDPIGNGKNFDRLLHREKLWKSCVHVMNRRLVLVMYSV